MESLGLPDTKGTGERCQLLAILGQAGRRESCPCAEAQFWWLGLKGQGLGLKVEDSRVWSLRFGVEGLGLLKP